MLLPRRPNVDENNNKSLKNLHFRVLISLLEPFASSKRKPGYEYVGVAEGNDDYEGYAIDLIYELSVLEGFNYTFIVQGDKDNGACDRKTKKWSGMIGAIIDNKADLAIGDMTITSGRQRAVDFTSPFMNLGISILYQKPRKAPPGFFSFADPFAVEVWAMVALSCLSVCMVLFILGRICATEWTNPYPCVEEPEFLENQLSLSNCFWFVSGSIMQQGTEVGPLAIPTKLLVTSWWFFTLIMVSSYTANLAVFLTRETPVPHFTDVFELVQNAEAKNIKWGAKMNGSTFTFFNESRDRHKEYGIIFDYMEKHADDVLVKDPTEGVLRAERENFAFFMEKTSIDYETARRCSLTSVGKKLLDEKSYGIAMRKNSTYRTPLSRAILHLQHTGRLNEIKRKWWEEKRGAGICEKEEPQSETLNLKNVGGVFWVTVGGLSIGIMAVIAELVLNVVKVSTRTKIPVKESLKEEFKFVFKFSEMVKPVAQNYQSSEISSRNSES